MSATLDTTTLSDSLQGLSVADAMHSGLVTCPPEASLRTVARLLATYRVHGVVVFPRHEADAGPVSAWKVISDVDIAWAASTLDLDAATAADLTGGAVRCVQPDQSLASAVTMMLTVGVTHVIVVDRPHGRPVGILSTLDVARAIAEQAPPQTRVA
jgi:CBS domain-containing protein